MTVPSREITASTQGRPQVQLALNPDIASVVHGSLSYGRLTLCISDYAGSRQTSGVETLMTEGLTGRQIADQIFGAIQRLTPDTANVISLGVQGTTTKTRDAVLWSPILADTALEFPHELARVTKTGVIIENDCTMITRALNQRQKGQIPTFGSVLMSYGIGMGLQVNGAPFLGGRSSATEFGHLPYRPGGAQCRCGKTGCIEAYASDYAIWRRATGQDAGSLPDVPISATMIQTIIDRATATDGPDRTALREAASALGVGLATMFTLFDPFPVVFIGPGSALVSMLEQELRNSLRENFRVQQRPNLSFQTETEETALIEQGAAIAALQSLDQQIAYSAAASNSASNL